MQIYRINIIKNNYINLFFIWFDMFIPHLQQSQKVSLANLLDCCEWLRLTSTLISMYDVLMSGQLWQSFCSIYSIATLIYE